MHFVDKLHFVVMQFWSTVPWYVPFTHAKHVPNDYIQLNMRLRTHTCSDIMGLLVGCCMAKKNKQKKTGSMDSKLLAMEIASSSFLKILPTISNELPFLIKDV